jgi:hypothetical protein
MVPTAAVTSTAVLTTGTTGTLYNCVAGDYYNVEVPWSKAKHEWCCKNKRLGCETVFNCSPEDKDNALSTWSQEKVEFCCKSYDIGCGLSAAQPRFDCDVDSASWRTSWSVAKQKWCCRHRKRGCVDIPDCNYGHAHNDYSLWSVMKKEWCCMHENVLCEQVYAPQAAFQPMRLVSTDSFSTSGHIRRMISNRNPSTSVLVLCGSLLAVALGSMFVACRLLGATRPGHPLHELGSGYAEVQSQATADEAPSHSSQRCKMQHQQFADTA